MWYEVLVPGPVLMIPILIMTTKGTHSPKTGSNQPSDVIVTYTNHAEAHDDIKPIPAPKSIPTETSTKSTAKYHNKDTYHDFGYSEKSTNTFIPKNTKKDQNNIVVSTGKNKYQDDFAYAEKKSTDVFNYDQGYRSTTKEPSTEVIDSEYGLKPLKEELAKKPRKLKKKKTEPQIVEDPEPEDVVFIPNEREPEPIRNEYYLQKEHASLQDLMGGHKTVEDLLASKDVRLETETPGPDIIFVTGKNNENQEISTKQPKKWSEDGHIKDTTPSSKLDCSDLNCNNTIDSVCGEKIENYSPKLRLFLNECYFRKVNCNFKSAANRYYKVHLLRCKHIGAHYNVTPFSAMKQEHKKQEPKSDYVDNTRRNFSSRRSMTMNIHGQFCSHPCPASCPELYEPECAVSSTGRHRVFMNHCALDHNSCSFGIVWHSVPLAECVGGKKAEMRQNAGFIGWMQRVGVVDKKGRLAYDVDRR